ncbi:hypothetical protein LXA43DRAFT_1068509 [Ganoderma leucocontextum]|nr:hypothetical protein LXA43DRAFT_1068509 [Ganoderma leucocontextum]
MFTVSWGHTAYQLGITESSLVVAYPSNLQVALSAMKACRIPETSLVLLDGHLAPDAPFPSIESLIEEHESHAPYVEHKFKPGEAKTAVAFLCFSSGTTGNPKAVAVSHYNAICAIIQNAMSNRVNEQYTPWKDQRFRPGDICDGTSFYAFRSRGLIPALRSGRGLMYRLIQMTLVVAKAFVFEKYLQNIQRYRITNLTMVPPQAVLLCKHPLTKKYDLSSVRYCVVAAAPLSPELTTELLKGYGMTETSCVVSNFPTSMKVGVLGSCGRLAPGTIAKVVKEDGELAGVGESGELLVQGPQIVVGYFRNPKATEEAFDNGWLRTGDEVRFDAEGNIFIVDRIKELIKVKGLQVAPSELEGYLLSDPDVADAAVVGVPDEYAGELPRAYVVLKPVVADAVKKDERLAGQVRAGLYETIASAAAKYKRLEGGIEFMDAIPKNPSGKILRRVLREQGQRFQGERTCFAPFMSATAGDVGGESWSMMDLKFFWASGWYALLMQFQFDHIVQYATREREECAYNSHAFTDAGVRPPAHCASALRGSKTVDGGVYAGEVVYEHSEEAYHRAAWGMNRWIRLGCRL